MRKLCAAVLAVLLTCGLLSTPPVAGTVAQAASTPKPKTSPAHPVRGVQFTVSGRISTRVARPVRLQRQTGSSWVTAASGKTTSSGRYSFRVTSTWSSTKFRVYAPKAKVGKKTYPRLVSPSTTVRTATVTPIIPMAQEKFTVVESLQKRGARTAVLQRRVGSSWRTLSKARSRANGIVTFTASLSASSSLRVIAPKTTIKKKRLAQITLPSFTVRLAAQSGTMSLPSSGITGQALKAQVRFSPVRAGRVVELQQYKGSQWVRVASGSLDATGRATLAVAPTTTGTLTLRASAVAYKGAPARVTAAATATIDSGEPKPSIILGNLSVAVTGEGYDAQLSAVGGTAPYTWSATGLPEGMSLDKDGKLSGTPTEPGTYTISITVTDATGQSAQATSQFEVKPVVGIETKTLPKAIAAQYYETTVVGSGGTEAYTWQATGLPTGLTMSDDGMISGTTDEVGDHPVTLTITDAKTRTATKDVTLTVTEALALTTDSLDAAITNTHYEHTLTATGGLEPYTWAVTGLPNGITVDPATGVLSGSPTEAGTFSHVEITVTDDNGYSATKTLTMVVALEFSITTTSLPNGVAGTLYTETPLTTSTGTAPFTWSATHLPDGLALDPTSGVISGTPTQAGTFDEIAVSVTDADHRTTQRTFTVVIAPAIHITTTSLPAAVAGTEYPQTALTAAGGNADSIFWAADNLPDGLTLNGNTGVLSGTPTTAGTSNNVTFTVTDADGKSAQKTLTITVAPAVHITTTDLPAGVAGTQYTATTLTAADGNPGDYTWKSTTLPDGLTLSDTGVLSGTPTTAGIYNSVDITVTDAAGKSANHTFTITVAPAVHITTTDLPAGVAGTQYTATTLTAADGTPDYTWTAAGLPLGLTLSSAGVLSGTPTQDGTFAVAVTATDSKTQKALTTFTLTIAKAVHITTTVMPDAVVGTDYQANLVAAGGNTPYVWDVENLPAGLHLNPEFGTVTGAPSQAGTFEDVTFTVTDGSGKSTQKTLTITVAPAVHITTTDLPNGVAGTQYTATTLTAADGNPGDYTWKSTTLPDGLTLSDTGVLSGTPTTAGIYNSVDITVTDAAGKSANHTFTITVAPAVHITTTDLPAGVAGTQYTATTLTAADGNPGDYTWKSTTLPDGLTLSASGILTGTPTTAGVYNSVKITVTDAAGKPADHTFTITVTPAVHITTTTIPDGVAEAPYSATLAAEDGTPGYTWASNDLPTGLHLDADTGVISGTPTTAVDSWPVHVTVTDSQGKHDTTQLGFKIGPPLRVATATLPNGVVDVTYGATPLSAIDGHGAPYTWSSSTLPDGLTISSDGTLSGRPTTAGTFDAVKITVTDAAGVTADATFTITIAPPVHITTATLPGGVVGTDYTATLTAADGQSDSYSWHADNLPDGLTLDDSTGKITGAPTIAKAYDPVTITVTDGATHTAQANFTIIVVPAVHITTADLPAGVAGTQYTQTTLTAADGNPGDYTWESTTLPDGLALSSDGKLTGTPTTAGVYNSVKITVTDAAGKPADHTFTITVTPAVHITTTDLPDAVLEEAYPATTLAAADGNGGYTWLASGLPEGVTIDTDTGALSGTPTQSGTFDAVTITVTDAKGGKDSHTFTLTVHALLAVTTAELPNGVLTEQYATTLAGLGGTKPYTWAVTGLPQGLSLNTATGEITGTPTETGSFDLGVTLTDDHGKDTATSLTVTVRPAVGITTASLPTGVVGTSYSATLAASGGTAPYRWTATALPSTLTLSEAGVITGMPDSVGILDEISITVTDAHGKTATFWPTLTIIPAVHITTTAIPDGVVGTEYSATLTSADGNGAATWTSTGLPAGLNLNESTGEITGIPTAVAATIVTFTATDPKGATDTWTAAITVAPAVHIITTTLPGGIVNDDYSANLTAADGNGTATWSSTDLPAGLTLNADTGALTGIPTAAGKTEVTFTATDPKTVTATWTTTITVIPAVHVTTTSLPSVEAQDAYPETTLSAADGTPGYSWTSTALPDGLTLSTDGKLTGTPTSVGDTVVTFTATDAHGKTGTAELTITVTAAVHLSSTLAIGVVGGDYTSTLTAAGGTAPYTISATSLPEGLSFSDGTISGTPTAAGTNTPVQITVTDARGKSSTTTPGLTVVKAVPQAAGTNHTCAITPSGGVQCWGANNYGQLGDGTTSNSAYPVDVTGLGAPAISVSAGSNSTCAILSNGKVDCWGYNSFGQVGSGDTDTNAHSTPVAVSGISSAVTIAAGQYFACATLSDGTGKCWGEGIYGQLGAGNTSNAATPVPVKNLTGLMGIDTGAFHACAVSTSGAVSCWGRNAQHQLGSGAATTGIFSTPVPVPDILPATSVSTHLASHSCVTTTSGSVQCWGMNSAYQAGTNSGGSVITPVTVAGVSDARTVAVGASHSCAMTSSGTVHCWGSTGSGRLGDGNPAGVASNASPVSVALSDTATSVSAGFAHTCVTLATGGLECWGTNTNGQLATGFTATIGSPITVPAISNKYTALALGDDFACGLTSGGGVECWGTNYYGQLGNGTNSDSSTATQVTGLTSGVTAIDAGTGNACAVLASGGVECWGNNLDGRLGNNSTVHSSVPVPVTGLSSGAKAVSVGTVATCALMTSGSVKCWGTGSYGGLGNHSYASSSVPVDVANITDATTLAVGNYHACAVSASAGTQCWGNGGDSALGDGTTTARTYPGPVTNIGNGATTMSAGNNVTCAIEQGALKCWGANGSGQIGDGTTTDAAAATPVTGLSSGVTGVAVGASHACALTSSGTVKCWGDNLAKQLGGSSVTSSNTPLDVAGLSGVSSLVADNNSTCALLTDGTVKCWGPNNGNQFGISTGYSSTPVAAIGFNVPALSATSTTLDAGVAGTDYPAHQLAATGGVSPYTWTATGLPAGLSVSSDGVVSGTPTDAGTSEVTFTVTDVRGKTAQTTASITVAAAVHITTTSLPGGVIGVAYSTQLEAADGTAAYTWSSDVVPDGLTLSAGGALSGTPTGTTPGTTMQITVTDHNGKTTTQAFTIVITPVIHGAAALNAGTNLACAVTDAGGVECWGKNHVGQLGEGFITPDSTVPVPVVGLSSGVRMVAAGAAHACALTDAGGVKCWGTNQIGQLGDGSPMGLRGDNTPYNSATPVDVVGLTTGVKAIAAGANHTCAVTNAGAVKCWGYNFAGGLGNNTTTNSNVPVDVTGLSSGVTALAGTNASTCALTSGGDVKCWGSNTNGQVGDGSVTDRWTPVDVSLGSGVSAVAISAHGMTACALTTDGAMKCWGRNNAGQLGDGSQTDSSTPLTPSGMTGGVAAISVGHNNVCAVTTAGGVKCWGDNFYGQLGDGTTTGHLTPSDVPGLSSAVAQVSVGATFICARLDSGAVKCLGANDVGQGGNGFRITTMTPTDVFGYGPVAVRIATSGLPVGEVGHAYPATTINHAGGSSPYTWSATGLPAGLSINTSTGVLSGTPTEAGTFNAVTITLTDGTDARAQTTLSLRVASATEITTTSLPSGLVNTAYSTTVAASGDAGPYVWSATGLPPGLTIDASTGKISGTPTAPGDNVTTTVIATDSLGYATETTLPLQVTVDAGPVDETTAVIAATTHTCTLNNIGGVECWGRNTAGQLGDGTTTSSTAPVQVTGLTSGVVSLSVTGNSSCAVTSSGGVKCWGNNTSGQLGNGTTTNSSTPAQVTGLTSGVASVAMGYNQACAIMTSGGVKCWGLNNYGQLGNGTTTNSSTPVDVIGLSDVTAIAAGVYHLCALSSSGGLSCWGGNSYGQLGDGTTNNSSTPVAVTGLTGSVSAMSVGGYHTCAQDSAGLKCWGYNSSGQLGDGTTTNSSTPVAVSGVSGTITSVVTGTSHTCVVPTTGPTTCWGLNTSGQVGDGTLTSRSTPTAVIGLSSGIASITAGANHNCVLTSSHDVACWGNNAFGQLGNGESSYVTTAVAATGLSSGASTTATGYNHSCALSSAGAVTCWGLNSAGQLGNGTNSASSTAVPVAGLSSGVTAIAGGGSHTCALTSTGGVKCWGSNSNGQLGNGTTTDSAVPVDVTDLASGVTAITAGGSHTCALTSGGGIKCWGNNFAGAVGDSTTNDRYAPVDVTGLTSGVTAITAGGSHTCALTSGGGIKCWGYNDSGELGNGTNTSATTAADVIGLTSGATGVDAGGSETCAVTSAGGVKCWGYNSAGQIGNGTTTATNTAADVTGLASGVAAVNVGGYHVCARTTAGGIKCWGQGTYGQLGNGSLANATAPVDVTGLGSGVANVSAGNQFTCAVTTGGAVKCWGYNTAGQVGNSAISTLLPGAAAGYTFTRPLRVTTIAALPGTTGQAYTATLNAEDGTGAHTWATSALPNGLTLDAASGVISGTPTAVGTTSVTVTATDNAGATASATISLTVSAAPATVTIVTSSLASALKNADYHSSGAMVATGGVAPYTWAATNRPPGINVSSSGIISGIPTSSGSWDIVFTATDSAGHSGTRTLTMVVGANGPPG